MDADHVFAMDLARLIERGLVDIEADDDGAVPRFRPTATSTAADDTIATYDNPRAALEDLIESALGRGEDGRRARRCVARRARRGAVLNMVETALEADDDRPIVIRSALTGAVILAVDPSDPLWLDMRAYCTAANITPHELVARAIADFFREP